MQNMMTAEAGRRVATVSLNAVSNATEHCSDEAKLVFVRVLVFVREPDGELIAGFATS